MSIDPAILCRITDNDKTLTELQFDPGFQLGNRWGVFSETPIESLTKALKGNQAVTSLSLRQQNLSRSDIKVLAAYLTTNRTLTLLDLSHNDLDAQAGKALAEALKVNRTLTSLKLQSSKLDIVGAEALAEALKVNKTLIDLPPSFICIEGFICTSIKERITDNKQRADNTIVLRKLKDNDPNLTSLDLCDNHFNAEECQVLFEVLKVNSALTFLNVGRIGLQEKEGSALAEVLKVNGVLTSLDLSGNILGGYGGKALAQALKINRTLRALELAYNSLNSYNQKVGEELAEVLKVNQVLTSLGLERNHLGLEAGKAFAAVLKDNRVITSLQLSWNNLGPEGGKALIEVLKVNKTLMFLGIGGNKLGVEEGKKLGEALRVNCTLVKLHAHANNFGAEGGQALAEALKVNCTLKTLSLGGSYYSRVNIKGSDAFAEMLKSNTTLTAIDLGYNEIYAEESKGFAEMLKVNATLTCLGLAGNKLGEEGGALLAKALQVNETLIELQCDSSHIPNDEMKTIEAKIARNKQRAEQRAQEAKKKAAASLTPMPIPVPGLLVAVNPPIPRRTVTIGQDTRRMSQSELDNKHAQKDTAISPVSPVAAQPVIVSKQSVSPSNSTTPEQYEKDPLGASIVKQHKQSANSEQAEQLQAIDTTALQLLQGQGKLLQRLLDAEAKSEIADGEKAYIETNPALHTYFRFSARILTGTWIACQGINSKLLENNKKFTSDYFASAFNMMGKCVPGMGLVTECIQEGVRKWNIRSQRGFVERLGLMFPDLESAFKQLGLLARQLTLAQEEPIKTAATSSPTSLLERAKTRLQNVKAAILADDVNEPISRKARVDCQKIFDAIKDDRPCPNPTIKDLLEVVLGRNHVYQPKVSAALQVDPTPTPVPPQSPQTPSSPSMTLEQMMAKVQQMEERERQQVAEMKRLRERDEAREREVKEMKRRLQRPDDETVVDGGSEAQVQASSALSPRDIAHQSAPIAVVVARLEDQVARLTSEVAVVQARQRETDNTLCVTVARVNQQSRKGKR